MQYIFIHGLGQNAASWNQTLPLLASSAQVLCPELSALLGHGEAAYAELYRAFSAYCSELSGALNLCGVSLGAILALNYAIDRPDKVQSMVLIAPQYKMPRTLLKLQSVIFRFMPKSAFSAMGFSKDAFIRLTGSMLDLDFSLGLKDISCDTLLLCGEKDTANGKAARNMAERIPNAKLRFVEGAGHEVNLDAPKELAGMLNEFYRGLRQ